MAASGLLLPPASSPRLGRSSAAGRAAPRPPVLRTLRAVRRTGPCCCQSITGWVGARGVGNACVVQAPQQPPVQHQKGKFLKTWGKRSASGPEGGPLWASGVGAVGLWAALLSTNPRQPPTCPSGRSGMAVVHH